MKSMTSYAYKELSNEDTTVSVEIKSYNSRFLDLNINYPPFLGRLEKRMREACSHRIQRGKVDVFIRVKETSPNTVVEVDTEAAMAYADAFMRIAEVMGKSTSDIPVSLVSQQEGVLSIHRDYDVESYWDLIEPVFKSALDDFIEDRKREGLNMKADLEEKLSKIEECEKIFVAWMPKMETAFKDNLLKRFKELCGDDFDEQRVMSETAALLVKYTISEEVVRLQSHIDAMKSELLNSNAPGRKLDFICQEMNREINTIGSKNQFTEIGQTVIAAKDALENIREQAKNVE